MAGETKPQGTEKKNKFTNFFRKLFGGHKKDKNQVKETPLAPATQPKVHLNEIAQRIIEQNRAEKIRKANAIQRRREEQKAHESHKTPKAKSNEVIHPQSHETIFSPFYKLNLQAAGAWMKMIGLNVPQALQQTAIEKKKKTIFTF